MTRSQFEAYFQAWLVYRKTVRGQLKPWLTLYPDDGLTPITKHSDKSLIWSPTDDPRVWALSWYGGDVRLTAGSITTNECTYGIDAVLTFEERVGHSVLDLETLAA